MDQAEGLSHEEHPRQNQEPRQRQETILEITLPQVNYKLSDLEYRSGDQQQFTSNCVQLLRISQRAQF
jgi:hypothetical protein